VRPEQETGRQGGHTAVAKLLLAFGTLEQKDR
jgi:hypothetical protein